MLEKIIYQEPNQSGISMGLPLVITLTEDSLITYQLGGSNTIGAVAYEMEEQEDGSSDQLVLTNGDSVTRITVQAYTDSLLLYSSNDHSWCQVFKPVKKFQQSYEQGRLQAMLTNQVYTLETPFADTSIVFEFLENRQLLFPHWLEKRERGLSYWLLEMYRGELFLSWEGTIGQHETVQVVAIEEDSIQLWSHQAQAYYTLKKQALTVDKDPKAAFIGYWKETTTPVIPSSNGKVALPPPPPPPPPLPYPEADLIRMAITKDSLRTLFFYADSRTPLEISPSGRYWLCRDVFGYSRAKKKGVVRVQLLGQDLLQLELLKRASWLELPVIRRYYMKRISKEEFIESRNR